jgi:hypothetical protein
MNFEAGALAKTLAGAFVCPYLFQMQPSDLSGPLAQFQAVSANQEGTLKLMHQVNGALDRPLEHAQLEEVFEMWWPKLDEQLKVIANRMKAGQAAPPSRRSAEEVLGEILSTVRALQQTTGDQAKIGLLQLEIGRHLIYQLCPPNAYEHLLHSLQPPAPRPRERGSEG